MRSAWTKASVLRGSSVGALRSERVTCRHERAAGVLQGGPRDGGLDPYPRGTTELGAGRARGDEGCAAGLKSSHSQRVGDVSRPSRRGGHVELHRSAAQEARTEGYLLDVGGDAQGQGAATANCVCALEMRDDCARDAHWTVRDLRSHWDQAVRKPAGPLEGGIKVGDFARYCVAARRAERSGALGKTRRSGAAGAMATGMGNARSSSASAAFGGSAIWSRDSCGSPRCGQAAR